MVEHADATKFGSSMSSCLPLLVFHHHPGDGQEDGDDEMLMFSISKQTLHKNMEHDLLAAGSSMCWTTAQGWILAQDRGTMSSSTCLWNPSTGTKLPLPDLGEEHQIPYQFRCLLSHKDPTHPGCVVVLFNNDAPDLWYCHTTGDGDNSSRRWRRYSYDIGNHPSMPEPPKGRKARLRCRRRPTKNMITFMASVQGKIYFTNFTKGMCTMD
ncbi:uncharacterized protein, partial [Miscanthus floridulus]|uniref:uncharacterized protein n=1 Tax=Miscanthus floridulus TaxID=154761 RepID=UPI0034597F54